MPNFNKKNISPKDLTNELSLLIRRFNPPLTDAERALMIVDTLLSVTQKQTVRIMELEHQLSEMSAEVENKKEPVKFTEE